MIPAPDFSWNCSKLIAKTIVAIIILASISSISTSYLVPKDKFICIGTTMASYSNTREVDADPEDYPIKLHNRVGLCRDSLGTPHKDGIYEGSYYPSKEGCELEIYLINLDDTDDLEEVEVTLEGTNPFTVDRRYNTDTTWWPMNPGDVAYFGEFKFNITSSVAMGTYPMVLKIKYVVDDIEKSGSLPIQIKIESGLYIYDEPELKLTAMETPTIPMPFYSGGNNQLVALRYVRSHLGDLRDVTMEFTSLPTGITMSETTFTVDELEFSEHFYWQIDSVASDMAPGTEGHDAYLRIEYTRIEDADDPNDDIPVVEENVKVVIDIADTPFLTPTPWYDIESEAQKPFSEASVHIDIVQGETTKAISINFENDGNMDLQDIIVKLDIAKATGYFFGTQAYYNADIEGCPFTSLPLECELGDLAQGGKASATFNPGVFSLLPPGLYKLPVDYDAKYIPTGSTFPVETHGGTDYGSDDFSNIMVARSPEGESEKPYVIVRVTDPDGKPNIQPSSATTLTAGDRNALLSVTLKNFEYYALNDVEVTITTGGTSPLLEPGATPGTQGVIEPLTPAGTLSADSTIQLQFVCDVREDATPGLNRVPILIEGLDPFNIKRSTNTTIPLQINPVLPEFAVTYVKAEQVKPGEKFELQIKLANTGGSVAKDVYVLFAGTNNILTPTGGKRGPYTIAPDEEVTVRFSIQVAPTAKLGTAYTGNILIKYTDVQGTVHRFDQTNAIPIRISTEPPASLGIDLPFALLILAIFIIVGIIISALLLGKAFKRAIGTGAEIPAEGGVLSRLKRKREKVKEEVPQPPAGPPEVRWDTALLQQQQQQQQQAPGMQPQAQALAPVPAVPGPPRIVHPGAPPQPVEYPRDQYTMYEPYQPQEPLGPPYKPPSTMMQPRRQDEY